MRAKQFKTKVSSPFGHSEFIIPLAGERIVISRDPRWPRRNYVASNLPGRRFDSLATACRFAVRAAKEARA